VLDDATAYDLAERVRKTFIADARATWWWQSGGSSPLAALLAKQPRD
jgi:hypothetical protein